MPSKATKSPYKLIVIGWGMHTPSNDIKSTVGPFKGLITKPLEIGANGITID